METAEANRDLWPAAWAAAEKALSDANEVASSGQDVPMRMRLLCSAENQFELLLNRRLHGEKVAERLFVRKVKTAENNRLYEEFRRILRESYMPENNMMSFEDFSLYPSRAMEYAKFCEQQLLKYGRDWGCGGTTCSFHQFDISRCREISEGKN